jgi:transposase
MSHPLSVQVTESVKELKALQKKHPGKYKTIEMLLLLIQYGRLSKGKLAVLLGVSDKSVQTWRSSYITGGITALLKEKRGGRKPAAITAAAEKALQQRLTDPRGGFRSFVELQQWLNVELGVVMNYQAVNKYVKRKYGAGLKVSRKSHVHKSAAAEAVFKKPV